MTGPRVARPRAARLALIAAVVATLAAALTITLVAVGGSVADRPTQNPSVVVDPSEVGPPPVGHGLSDALVVRLSESTVGVRGLDCGRAQVGSGFVVAGGLVATSAHVVAGIAAPVVTVEGAEVATRVVGFDPVADLAVLAPVNHGKMPLPLALGEAVAGTVGAMLVHESTGPRLVPAGIARRIRATGADIYGREADGRDALILAATVVVGHSGAAVVDGAGRVVGITFSRARGGSPVAYAVQSNALQILLERVRSSPEPAGPCVN